MTGRVEPDTKGVSTSGRCNDLPRRVYCINKRLLQCLATKGVSTHGCGTDLPRRVYQHTVVALASSTPSRPVLPLPSSATTSFLNRRLPPRTQGPHGGAHGQKQNTKEVGAKQGWRSFVTRNHDWDIKLRTPVTYNQVIHIRLRTP